MRGRSRDIDKILSRRCRSPNTNIFIGTSRHKNVRNRRARYAYNHIYNRKSMTRRKKIVKNLRGLSAITNTTDASHFPPFKLGHRQQKKYETLPTSMSFNRTSDLSCLQVPHEHAAIFRSKGNSVPMNSNPKVTQTAIFRILMPMVCFVAFSCAKRKSNQHWSQPWS